MRVASIVDRLTAEIEAFKSVSGAPALAAAMQNGQFTHSAYVFQSSRGAGDNTLVNKVSQRVRHEITVAFWVQNVADTTGEALLDTLEDLSDEVVAALLGWTPPGLVEPLLYKSGSVIDFRFGRALWADVFSINTTLRKA